MTYAISAGVVVVQLTPLDSTMGVMVPSILTVRLLRRASYLLRVRLPRVRGVLRASDGEDYSGRASVQGIVILRSHVHAPSRGSTILF